MPCSFAVHVLLPVPKQKMNESWMCEEEPEALERSASAKVGC